MGDNGNRLINRKSYKEFERKKKKKEGIFEFEEVIYFDGVVEGDFVIILREVYVVYIEISFFNEYWEVYFVFFV